jgi:hypothetical protein
MPTLLFVWGSALPSIRPQPVISSPLLPLSPLTTSPSTLLSRRLPTPHRLQEPVALRQSVQAVVALGAAAHEAAERVDLVLAGVVTRFVDFADADLHGGVVFGFDDAVCGGAFAGDVAVRKRKGLV